MNWLRKLTARSAFLRRLPRLLRKHRVPLIVLWTAAVVALTQTAWFGEISPLQRLEQKSIDARFHRRGPQPPDPNIILVGIKDSTLNTQLLAALAPESEAIAMMAAQRMGCWNRRVWAVLIERLMQAGAKVVALDLIFDGEFAGNDELAAVVARHRDRLVLGAKFEKSPGGTQATFIEPDSAIIGEGDELALIGSCSPQVEMDGTIRRVSFRTSVERETGKDEQFLRDFGIEDQIVSFAPAAVAKFTGKAAPHGLAQLIPFQGYAGLYPPLAMEEVLADSIFLKDPHYRGGAAFKGKIVFVGPIAEIMHDIHETPFGGMPGVEVHAQLAGALLRGSTLHDAPPGMAFWATLGVGLAAAAVLIFCRQALTQSAVLAALTVALAVAAQLFFTNAQTLVPVVPPAFALFGIGVLGVLFTVAIEQLEKARIRGVLDQYVSKNVADVVLKHSENFEQMMRGERKNVTIVFSDVRGFTSIFESSDERALVEQLNEYFLQMARCIHEQGGTLQKYIGDAIMAAWGDTHSLGHEEDATRAVRTALAMRTALRELNELWKKKPPLVDEHGKEKPSRVEMNIGIGVNHGQVVVGEVGSPERKEFTLLGDAVNSAARFESATKQYHVDLLVGGSVEEMTREKFVYRAVDRARFKGKTHPIEVFAALSDAKTPAPAWLARWHEAIAHFRAARFAEAAPLFREVGTEIGGEDFLCEMYLARIAIYQIDPPPAGWDGAHTLSEK